MRSQPERVAECTSINFDGMIAMVKPGESWVAKWQRISTSKFKSASLASVPALNLYGPFVDMGRP
jgi:hypothetical protein